MFLKNLRNYQSSANKANGTTVKLLTDTLRCVADFIGGAETIKAGNDKLFFDIDEDRFEFRRLILCRVCHVRPLPTHFISILKITDFSSISA